MDFRSKLYQFLFYPLIVRRNLKTIKRRIYNIDINIDFKDLKGKFKNKVRIRKGSIRVIIEILEDEVIIESIVEDIDFRGNIYK